MENQYPVGASNSINAPFLKCFVSIVAVSPTFCTTLLKVKYPVLWALLDVACVHLIVVIAAVIIGNLS